MQKHGWPGFLGAQVIQATPRTCRYGMASVQMLPGVFHPLGRLILVSRALAANVFRNSATNKDLGVGSAGPLLHTTLSSRFLSLPPRDPWILKQRCPKKATHPHCALRALVSDPVYEIRTVVGVPGRSVRGRASPPRRRCCGRANKRLVRSHVKVRRVPASAASGRFLNVGR